MRIVIGLLLLVHGLIHIAIYNSSLSGAAEASGQGAFKLVHSWALSPLGFGATSLKIVGTPLWVIAGVGFMLAGLAVLHVLPVTWWHGLAVAAVVASLLLFAIFWHPWLIAAVVADVAVLVGLLVAGVPLAERVGA